MSEPITYWKWTRDGMIVAACPELQDGLYVIRERYDALQAKVRELEQERDQARARAYEEAAYYLEYKASGPIPPDAIDHMKDCAKRLREEGGHDVDQGPSR